MHTQMSCHDQQSTILYVGNNTLVGPHSLSTIVATQLTGV